MSALPHSDRGAATGLYERHRSRLVGFCTAQMGSRDEAEDAVQDTFIYALRALRRGVVPESETAWLFTIARNVCSSRRRNGSRRSRLVVTRDLDALQDVLPAQERHRDELFGLREALATMPASQRQAILLREWQGLTYAEIAEALDLSGSAVETLLFRARRSLARALERTSKAAARALNVSPAFGLVRSLLETGGAKVVAGTLAVAAAGTIGGTSIAPRRVVVASTAGLVVRAPRAPRIAPAAPNPRAPRHVSPVQVRQTRRSSPRVREVPSTAPAAAPAQSRKAAPPPAAPRDASPAVSQAPLPASAEAPPAAPPSAPAATAIEAPPQPEVSVPAPSLPPALPAPPSLPPAPVALPPLPAVTIDVPPAPLP